MSTPASRRPALSPSLLMQGQAIPLQRMSQLEGHESSGHVDLRPMMVGEDMLMVEIHEKAGVRVPTHVHHDHESIVYLIQGRMKLVIGEQHFEAVAGDAWRHPAGVPHYSEALEDCLALEVKSPPRKTWRADDEAV